MIKYRIQLTGSKDLAIVTGRRSVIKKPVKIEKKWYLPDSSNFTNKYQIDRKIKVGSTLSKPTVIETDTEIHIHWIAVNDKIALISIAPRWRTLFCILMALNNFHLPPEGSLQAGTDDPLKYYYKPLIGQLYTMIIKSQWEASNLLLSMLCACVYGGWLFWTI